MLVEVNCESDFVARTDDFQQLVKDVLAEIEQAGDAATDAWLQDPNGPVQQRVAAGDRQARREHGGPPLRPLRRPGLRRASTSTWAARSASRSSSAASTPRSGRARGVRRRSSRKSRCRLRRPARPTSSRDGGAGRRPRQGESDLPRADGELGQAGASHRQDRRGQAGQLLLAGRAARSAVDPRSEDDGRRTCSPPPTRRSARR